MVTPPERSETFLAWYAPISTTHDSQYLRWQFTQKTYDVQSHEVGKRDVIFDFPSYNIRHPVLARSVVSLLQMGVLPASQIVERLNGFKEHATEKSTIQDFLYKTAEGDTNDILAFASFHGALTGGVLREVTDFSLFNFFESLQTNNDNEKAIKAIDAFVQYYVVSRELATNRGMQIAEKLLPQLDAIDTQLNYGEKNSVIQSLVKNAYNELPQRSFRGQEMEVDVVLLLELLTTFLESAIEANCTIVPHPGVTIDNSNEMLKVILDEDKMRAIERIFFGELVSGVWFIHDTMAKGSTRLPRTRRSSLTPLQNLKSTCRNKGRLTDPSECPFLTFTWDSA